MSNQGTGSSPVRDAVEIVSTMLRDDGVFPNSKLPLLIYRQALALSSSDSASAVEHILASHGWGGSWRNGIYPYHHYHSTAHEVLVVTAGHATVQLGGERGLKEKLETGDVVIIPAGVAHKNLGSSSDFQVVGAYPAGEDWDLLYGREGERPKADQNIARVPLPKTDPVYGFNGPVIREWASAKR